MLKLVSSFMRTSYEVLSSIILSKFLWIWVIIFFGCLVAVVSEYILIKALVGVIMGISIMIFIESIE